MVKTKSPLGKRYKRQLLHQAGKYLAIFLFMVLFIGLISGYMVADSSMILAYDSSFETYRIEDGHFRTARPLTESARASLERRGIRLYDLPYLDLPIESGGTLRLYPWREEVNQICLMEGEEAKGEDSLCVDRLWAKNNQVKVGDSLTVDGHAYTVTGLAAFSDYSALFENNGDMMFDSLRFCVGAVSPDCFSRRYGGRAKNCYAYLEAEERPDGESEQDRAKSLAMAVSRLATLEEFTPRYANQAIQFTGDDMVSDRAMMLMLLYILIAIMAFIFALTSKGSITREASLIGTLRATGCTRGELLLHYMLLPILVTLAAAVAGNLLGYTYFKELCAGLYYASYSLPAYRTVWSPEAFVITSVFPVLLMAGINGVILSRALSLPPIRFLRGEVSLRRRRRALPLSEGLPFLTRFRQRIFLSNLPGFLTLFVGFLFANVLLYFGLMLPVVLDRYQKDIESGLPSAYQVVLSVEDERLFPFDRVLARYLIQTETEGAEEYCLTALETLGEGGIKQESISLYGIRPDSAYLPLDFSGWRSGMVLSSEGFAEKYGLREGDSFTLKELYGEETYAFTLAGTCHYPASLALFLPIGEFRKLFSHESWYHNGYFSDEPVEDLPEELLSAVLDVEDMTKLSRQLDVSFGGMMEIVVVFSVIFFLLVQYLLLKLVIEKNARSISLLKVLGASDREAAALYLGPMTAAAVLCIAATIPLADVLVRKIFSWVLSAQMTGWIPLFSSHAVWGKMALFGLGCYGAVALLEFFQIKRIPMTMVLKDVM